MLNDQTESVSLHSLFIAIATLLLVACSGGGDGLAVAASQSEPMQLLVFSDDSVGVTIGQVDFGVTKDQCPSLTPDVSVDGVALKMSSSGGWVSADLVCIDGCGPGPHCEEAIYDSSGPLSKAAVTSVVSVDQGAEHWEMQVEQLFAARTITLTSGATTVSIGDTLTFALSPASDDVWSNDGTGTSPVVTQTPSLALLDESGKQVGEWEGTLASGVATFKVPSINKGSYQLRPAFRLTPHVSKCDGPGSCSVFYEPAQSLCDAAGHCSSDDAAAIAITLQ
jgi:hypothetical protein